MAVRHGLWGLLSVLLLSYCAESPWQILLNQMYRPETPCQFVTNSWGQRVSWNQQIPVRIHLHQSFDPSWVGPLRSAIARWNQNPWGRQLIQLDEGPPKGSASLGDGVNVIGMIQNWENQNSSQQGKTLLRYFLDQIIEADVWINGAHFTFSTSPSPGPGQVDLESLLIHELGHVLGLSHAPPDKPQSVMAPYLSLGTTRRNILEWDFANLGCEYGR